MRGCVVRCSFIVCVAALVTGCVATQGRLTRDTLSAPAPARRSYVDALKQRARQLHLATARPWLLLGHWRGTTFGGFKSEADGANFFLAADGKTDPQAELDATLDGFFSDLQAYDATAERNVQHPLCQFPARFMFLSKQLAIDATQLPAHDCARYRAFVESVQADSVTLVFSSYYLNNPASAFGHTFLRLGKKNALVPEQRRQLLDYGIDYAADPDTTFAPIYAVKGIIGAFPGTFRKVPFYYKVRQYNDFESRDLWEYKLNFSSDEIEYLVAHVWELGSTFFDYFYLTENCSYHVLDLLEAAAPRVHLLDELHWPVIPVDAVKALFHNDGFVGNVEFRASSRTRFRRDLADLTSEQRDAVVQVADDPKAPLPFDDRHRIQILDAAQDLVDLRFAKQLVDASRGGVGVELKQKLLERRAEILLPSDDTPREPPWTKMPQRGHPSRRFGLGAGFDTGDGRWLAIGGRLALHDLADATDGYPDLAQLEFLATRVRLEYPADHGLHLDQLDLVHVVSLTSQDRFDRHISWEFRLGSERLVADPYCKDCYVGRGQIGGGVAFASEEDRVTLFVLGETQIWAGPHVDGVLHAPIRVGFGPSVGLRVRFTHELVMLLRGEWDWLPKQPDLGAAVWSASGILRWMVVPGFALDAQAADDDHAKTGVLSSLLYF